MNKKLIFSFIIILSLTIFFTSCGQNSTAPSAEQVEVQAIDLESSSSEDLPQSIQCDEVENFPLYRGAICWYSMQMDDAIQNMYAVPATISEVSEFYQSELVNGGWNISMSMNTSDGNMLMASQDGTNLSIVIAEENEYEGYTYLSVTANY